MIHGPWKRKHQLSLWEKPIKLNGKKPKIFKIINLENKCYSHAFLDIMQS